MIPGKAQKEQSLSPFLSAEKTGGFTLLEILISLVLLTIVLGAVYSSFFSVHHALDRFESVSLKYYEARTVLDRIRREIEGSVLKKDAGFSMLDRDVFGKSSSRLTLTSASLRGGLSTISYFAALKGETMNLMKTESPARTGAQQYTMEIMEGIRAFTVETEYNRQWVKTWDTDNTGKLPGLVRIILQFDDNGRPVTLREYARPMVGKQL